MSRTCPKPRPELAAVTKHIACVFNNVANIDAHSKFNRPVGGDCRIAYGHAALNFDGAFHCFDDARELDKHAVARGLDDAAAMGDDGGLGDLATVRFHGCERANLVSTHQQGVAGNVRRQHSRQSPLHAFVGHEAPAS